jgi:hypothetical protein
MRDVLVESHIGRNVPAIELARWQGRESGQRDTLARSFARRIVPDRAAVAAEIWQVGRSPLPRMRQAPESPLDLEIVELADELNPLRRRLRIELTDERITEEAQ